VRACSEQTLFRELAPLSATAIKRREPQEFVLRFFAYLRDYQRFDRSVVGFLNAYLDDMKESFGASAQVLAQAEWDAMLQFVNRYFPNGFRKKDGHVRTPRIRFEAISVGAALALRIQPDLVPASLDWLEQATFKEMMRSDASNSRPKIVRRIEFVRDQLLGRAA
jgi:hypothetical protein